MLDRIFSWGSFQGSPPDDPEDPLDYLGWLGRSSSNVPIRVYLFYYYCVLNLCIPFWLFSTALRRFSVFFKKSHVSSESVQSCKMSGSEQKSVILLWTQWNKFREALNVSIFPRNDRENEKYIHLELTIILPMSFVSSINLYFSPHLQNLTLIILIPFTFASQLGTPTFYFRTPLLIAIMQYCASMPELWFSYSSTWPRVIARALHGNNAEKRPVHFPTKPGPISTLNLVNYLWARARQSHPTNLLVLLLCALPPGCPAFDLYALSWFISDRCH